MIESLTNKELTQSHPPINILHSFYIFIHLSTNISLFFTGRMHITTSAYAAALYGGLLGAFLEASRDTISQEHDQNHLQQCREWLLMHNPLIRQFDWCLHAPTSPFPTVHISDSTLETNPPM